MNSVRLTAFCLLFVAARWPQPLRATAPSAVFHWFEYSGHDPVFARPLPPDDYRNPIIAGFHPDPSICRVGRDYYLVNSSFAWFPGIPIFHSRDLVHWTQIGYVLDRPSQLKLDGLGVSRGVFAPTIRYHDGLFYVINTLVDAGGNFFVTAKNPAGPWSDPVWLPQVDGIDPSFFFDTDGRAYVLNNGPPPDNKPLYSGHRAIWMQEFAVAQHRLTGPRRIIVNGGTDLSRHPVWIEGPHLFRKDGWYYLICAQGGTGYNHSEVVFRSRKVWGPYVPWDRDPILTQRNLPPGRPDPVTCTGHADFVRTPGGAWWAVFLGCRPYAGDYYNTGRETFMLPVTWTDDGWPLILPPGQPVPYVDRAPAIISSPSSGGGSSSPPLTGNFTWRDDFNRATLALPWNTLRGPAGAWLSLTANPGSLTLTPTNETLGGRGTPALIARRQQHAHFDAATSLRIPAGPGVSAGLVAFQNATHYYFLGVRRRGNGLAVFLERADRGPAVPVANKDLPPPLPASIELRMVGDGARYTFFYATAPDAWQPVGGAEDGTVLSTQVAGGFVGTMLGLYAQRE